MRGVAPAERHGVAPRRAGAAVAPEACLARPVTTASASVQRTSALHRIERALAHVEQLEFVPVRVGYHSEQPDLDGKRIDHDPTARGDKPLDRRQITSCPNRS
jgi:hypothetical protein